MLQWGGGVIGFSSNNFWIFMGTLRSALLHFKLKENSYDYRYQPVSLRFSKYFLPMMFQISI